MTPVIRAIVATTLFTLAGLWGITLHDGGLFVYPHAIFYAILTINTFFSVRFFSEFAPKSVVQMFFDALLVLAYLGLALSIGLPHLFALCALVIFLIAPLKYIHMRGKTAYDATLKKKITIDLVGTGFCVLIFVLTVMGVELYAAWVLAIMFGVANIYLLVLNPMYRHVEVR